MPKGQKFTPYSFFSRICNAKVVTWFLRFHPILFDNKMSLSGEADLKQVLQVHTEVGAVGPPLSYYSATLHKTLPKSDGN